MSTNEPGTGGPMLSDVLQLLDEYMAIDIAETLAASAVRQVNGDLLAARRWVISTAEDLYDVDWDAVFDVSDTALPVPGNLDLTDIEVLATAISARARWSAAQRIVRKPTVQRRPSSN